MAQSASSVGLSSISGQDSPCDKGRIPVIEFMEIILSYLVVKYPLPSVLSGKESL